MANTNKHTLGTRKKRKPLTLEANACPEHQWADYKEAVCPLLQEFGCFDEA